MSKYILYGTKLIANDNTLRDFAQCVYESCPLETVLDNEDERTDFIMQCVNDILSDDLSRTDINYEKLLFRYRDELGDLFFRMWEREICVSQPEFTGEKAKPFFNEVVYYYILLHFEEFSGEIHKNNCNDHQNEEPLKQYYVSYSGGHIVTAKDDDEACEFAMDEISLDDVNAYLMNDDGTVQQ